MKKKAAKLEKFRKEVLENIILDRVSEVITVLEIKYNAMIRFNIDEIKFK